MRRGAAVYVACALASGCERLFDVSAAPTADAVAALDGPTAHQDVPVGGMDGIPAPRGITLVEQQGAFGSLLDVNDAAGSASTLLTEAQVVEAQGIPVVGTATLSPSDGWAMVMAEFAPAP